MENHSKPNIKLTVPFFRVADMEVSMRFYMDGLGFTITNQWTPRGKIEWCWLHEFKERGLTVQEPFVGNGMWVVLLKDPDAYTLDFESLTDVKEEATYTEWRKGQS